MSISEHSDPNRDDADGELHIEVTPLVAPAADPRPTRPHPRRHARVWRAVIAGTAIAVALVVIFSGFLPLRTPLTG